MNVRNARIFGLLLGFFLGTSPAFSDLVEQIGIINLTIALVFIVFGRRVTGPNGSLLYGLGVGITLGSVVATISLL